MTNEPTRRGIPDTLEDVKSLGDRLVHARKLRGWSEREFSRRANLAESHVNWIIKTDRETDGGAKVEISTLQALADAASVSFEWLALGRGHPEPTAQSELPPDPLYPSRARAVAGARLLGYPEEAIAAVRSVSDLSDDPGLLHWQAILQIEKDRVLIAKRLPSSPPTGRKRKQRS